MPDFFINHSQRFPDTLCSNEPKRAVVYMAMLWRTSKSLLWFRLTGTTESVKLECKKPTWRKKWIGHSHRSRLIKMRIRLRSERPVLFSYCQKHATCHKTSLTTWNFTSPSIYRLCYFGSNLTQGRNFQLSSRVHRYHAQGRLHHDARQVSGRLHPKPAGKDKINDLTVL